MALLLGACATEEPLPTITVATSGDEAVLAVSALRASPPDYVALRFAQLPVPRNSVAEPSSSGMLVALRQQYAEGDFDQCHARLRDGAVVLDTLGAGEASLAARLNLWRIACAAGLPDVAAAERAAQDHAVLALDVPMEIERMSPSVELHVAESAEAVSNGARTVVTIETPGAPGARVQVDARVQWCPTPCAVELPHGDHVVRVEADGFVPTHRVVHVDARADDTLSIELDRASPELAGQQWARRFALSDQPDSALSLRLLMPALRVRRGLVFLRAEREGENVRIRGAMAEAGEVQGRVERSMPRADLAEGLDSALLELLQQGGVVELRPLWRNPWLWVLLTAGIGIAVAVTTLVLYEPGVRLNVGFVEPAAAP